MGPLMGLCDEFRHTREPWSQVTTGGLGRRRGGDWVQITGENGRIARVYDGFMSPNADLIAAAPDMLAALCDWYDFYDDPNFPQERLIRQTEEAIGKAQDWE